MRRFSLRAIYWSSRSIVTESRRNETVMKRLLPGLLAIFSMLVWSGSAPPSTQAEVSQTREYHVFNEVNSCFFNELVILEGTVHVTTSERRNGGIEVHINGAFKGLGLPSFNTYSMSFEHF